jgi:phosphoribosyl-ATP pyrophosphohydrolase
MDPEDKEDIFAELFAVIESRRDERPEGSYTASLFDHEKGENAALEKLGEETTETVLAAKDGDEAALVEESADLVYHLFVVLAAHGHDLDDLRGALAERR